jgi:hypothetical protein
LLNIDLPTLIFQVKEFSSKRESPEIKKVDTTHISLPTKNKRQQWQMERQRKTLTRYPTWTLGDKGASGC